MKLKPYKPVKLPLAAIDWESLIPLIGKAHASLARFDALIPRIRNPELLTLQEALDSIQSQEGAITLKELILHTKKPRKNLEWKYQKILNYQEALEWGAKKHSISLQFLCHLHKIIKRDPEGNQSEIGHFRKRQNWIGPEGCAMEDAFFYPPDPKTLLKSMHNLKEYLKLPERDPLVQLAIFFAQFLTLHPFMDGNGRVARALVPLYLYKKKLISRPLFYLSGYFKKHRLAYLEKLGDISSNNEWQGWIEFFLKAMIE